MCLAVGFFFFFQAEDGIRDRNVTGVQTCALPISRFEEPQDIINDMLAGLNAQQMKKVISIVDRKEAIRTACMLAKKGDVILVAGKGHEDYQEIKGVKHHFDDKEVIRDIFGISQK